MRIEIVQGDITKECVDVIVNAANTGLSGGGGVDGAIHRAAGMNDLYAAARPLAPCPPGEVRVTPGFALPCKWIIHTVGPVWQGGGHGEAEVLARCYSSSLQEAERLEATSVAFPSISTGVYGYPADKAAAVAISTVRASAARLQLVRLVAFNTDGYRVLLSAYEGSESPKP